MRKFLQSVVIAVSIVLFVMLAARFLRRDEGFVKNHDFYETDEAYDVIYLGSSHAVMGVLPMEIWNEYGIPSFNLANSGQKLNGDYWILKNALEQKKPELVVLDACLVTFDQQWEGSTVNFLHESLDPMPLTKTKIAAILDLIPKDMQIAFFWPFSLYHSRWENVTSDYFISKVSYQKGAYENTDHMKPAVSSMQGLAVLERTQVDRTETVGKEYLRKAIVLCQEMNVPIVLTMIPFSGSGKELRYVNSVYEIAEEYGVPFLNGLEEDVVDPACDFLDSTHLNSSGARKWSSFLGAYMKENYHLADRRVDPAYADWDECYRNYRLYENMQLSSTKEMYPYLMLLADSGFSSEIKVAADSAIYADDLFWKLLKNAGGIEKPADSSAEQIFRIDNFKEGISPAASGRAAVPSDAASGIEVTVYDSRTGECVSHMVFPAVSGV